MGERFVRATRGPASWWVVAAACVLLLGTGCGTRDAQANASGSAAAPVAQSTTPAATPGTVRPPHDPLADSTKKPPAPDPLAFPHPEHRSFQCTHCHQSVPGHATHASAANCQDCHAPLGDYSNLPVRSRRQCMACHHNPARRLACKACHNPSRRGTLRVPVTLRLSVWDSARVRVFNFDHRFHTKLACNACHAGYPMYTPTTDCGSCHAPHHRDGAVCSRCHAAPADTTIHTPVAHGDCAACHAKKVIATLAPSRQLCLICHADKAQHEAPKACYECHMLGKSPTGVQP